ncbi:MAG: aldolase/citrate lyase family protein [Candidatus Latescibacterota bacterium]|nr:aldolase/citrate lyase family protein [Candidatus Latescibacterota bacterium]
MIFEGIESFRRQLAAGEVLLGAGIAFTDPQVSDALAPTADFLWIDLEHAAMSMEAMRGHLLSARAHRKGAVVRVPSSDTAFIKPVLDSGAPGIVVPQVTSAQEVADVVADCRYPPGGERGFGPHVPSGYGRDGGSDFVARSDRSLFVSVMIEHRDAVEAIDDIVSVEGLDAVVLGPYDLSGSLGLLGEVGHPTVVSAMEKVLAAARDRGLPVGSGMPVDAEFAMLQASRGVQWLQIGGDCRYMAQGADDIFAEIRARLKSLS